MDEAAPASTHLFFGIFPGIFAFAVVAEAPSPRDGQYVAPTMWPVEGIGGLAGAGPLDVTAGEAPLATPEVAAGGPHSLPRWC